MVVVVLWTDEFRTRISPLLFFFRLQISRTASPVDENMMGSAQPTDKPYKPKFHKAVLYNEQQHQHPSEEELRNTPISVPSLSIHNETAAYVPAAMVAATGASHWNRGPEIVHPNLINLQQHGGAPPPTAPSAMITANEMIKHGGNSSIPPRLSHLVSRYGPDRIHENLR